MNGQGEDMAALFDYRGVRPPALAEPVYELLDEYVQPVVISRGLILGLPETVPQRKRELLWQDVVDCPWLRPLISRSQGCDDLVHHLLIEAHQALKLPDVLQKAPLLLLVFDVVPYKLFSGLLALRTEGFTGQQSLAHLSTTPYFPIRLVHIGARSDTNCVAKVCPDAEILELSEGSGNSLRFGAAPVDRGMVKDRFVKFFA
jgi:hypothetical protein